MADTRVRLTLGPTTYRLLKDRAKLLELTVPNFIRYLIYQELGQAGALPKSTPARKEHADSIFGF